MAPSDLRNQMKTIAKTNFPHWFIHLKIIKKIQRIGAKRLKLIIRAMEKKSRFSDKGKAEYVKLRLPALQDKTLKLLATIKEFEEAQVVRIANDQNILRHAKEQSEAIYYYTTPALLNLVPINLNENQTAIMATVKEDIFKFKGELVMEKVMCLKIEKAKQVFVRTVKRWGCKKAEIEAWSKVSPAKRLVDIRRTDAAQEATQKAHKFMRESMAREVDRLNEERKKAIMEDFEAMIQG